MFVHAFAVTADFVRIAAHSIADNPGRAAFAIETGGARVVAAHSVTAGQPCGAAFAAAEGCAFATTHAVDAGSAAAFSAAICVAGRTANTADANLTGWTAGLATSGVPLGARLFTKGGSPEAKRRQHRAPHRTTYDSQHFAP